MKNYSGEFDGLITSQTYFENEIFLRENELTLNPLIAKIIEQETALIDFIENPSKKKQFWIHYANETADQIVFFENYIPYKFLFVEKIKLSFHDLDKTPILFEMTFLPGQRPQVIHYLLKDDNLKLMNISVMELNEQSDLIETFSYLTNSVAELKLEIYNSPNGIIYQVLNHNHNVIISINSIELIESPILKFHAFLNFLANATENIPTYTHIEEQTLLLLETILDSDEQKKDALDYLSQNPSNYIPLYHYKNKIPFEAKFLKYHTFLQLALLKKDFLEMPYSYEIKNCTIIDSKTLLFHVLKVLNHQTVESSLIILKNISLNSKSETVSISEIKETLHLYERVKKDFPNSKNNYIEFIVDKHLKNEKLPEYLEILLSKAISQNKYVGIKNISFCVPIDSKKDFYNFIITSGGSIKEDIHLRHVPHFFEEILELHRLRNFEIKQDYAYADRNCYLHYLKDKKDFRLRAISLVFFPDILPSPLGHALKDLGLEARFKEICEMIKASLETHAKKQKPVWNRIFFQIITVIKASIEDFKEYIYQLIESYRQNLNELKIVRLVFKLRLINIAKDKGFDIYLIEVNTEGFKNPEILIKILNEHNFYDSMPPVTPNELREQQIRARGSIWCYRIPQLINRAAEKLRQSELPMHNSSFEEKFIELDLDPETIIINSKTGDIDYNYGKLVPVYRPEGENKAATVIGIQTNDLQIGIPVERLIIIGDITHLNHGAITAQECARINAALRYAEENNLPIDWISASFGVEIQRDKGVEGLDASASTAREIIKFAHYKHLSINLIVDEANIGAQSYWDALATILMDTTGILIMTPRGSLALTGPNALVSALYNKAFSEDIPKLAKDLYPQGLQTLAGYENVHGPNSDATIFAKEIFDACEILLRHHYYTYVDKKAKLARERTFLEEKKEELAPQIIKEINLFQKGIKPNREKILNELRDKSSPKPVRFWKDVKGIGKQLPVKGDFAQEPSTIVQEMLIGGIPTLTIFTSVGSLTPADADLIARGIYKANRHIPVLILGSLSGFTCDPLSMQNRQLVEGASIAKAIVDHKGPILIVNMANLVGGTFVVFSKQLNPFLRILAIEGSHVQVVGGNAAAKVIFHSQILKKIEKDPRVLLLIAEKEQQKKNNASKKKLNELEKSLTLLKIQLITELEDKESIQFDQIHTVERALKVGSIDGIVAIEEFKESITRHLRDLHSQYLTNT